MQFQWNFTGLICSSCPCACCTGFPVEWFLAELWPFDKKVFFSVCCQIRKSLSRLLLINYWCNFIQTFQELSVPSLVAHCPSVCHKICPNMKLTIMRRHMSDRSCIKWAASWQNQHNGFTTSMDPDQPAHPRSLHGSILFAYKPYYK
jgi:hypothetical protein